jgi:hypothetical protein
MQDALAPSSSVALDSITFHSLFQVVMLLQGIHQHSSDMQHVNRNPIVNSLRKELPLSQLPLRI